MEETTLDTKILNKNLEITRISKQLDDLTSDYVALKEEFKQKLLDERDVLNQVVDLTKEVNGQEIQRRGFYTYKTNEFNSFHPIITTLNQCVGVLQRDEHQNEFDQGLKEKLEEVIKFLQQ